MQTIILGGGCFWCTEAIFRRLKGVAFVLPGYAGGDKPNPTYQEVSTGTTGHAEVVQIQYDESQISLGDLLTVFFASHDPTSLNRQGADIGPEYRSAIFYTEANQKPVIDQFISDINASAKQGKKIMTEVKPLDKFWEAEAGHQEYYDRNPNAAYCELVINPKLEKVQQRFAQLLKDSGEF